MDREWESSNSQTRKRSQRESRSKSSRGQDFERRVADRLETLGWEIQLTPGSGDGGVDIICRCGKALLVVQCKDWAEAVGFSAVQEIYTARDLHSASSAAVVAAKSFTQPARKRASQLSVMLLTLHDLRPGCSLDRSEEGKKIRLKRRAQAEAEATEAKRQRELQEAGVREAAAARAIEDEWRRYDADFAAYSFRVANRGDKLAYISGAALLVGLTLLWLRHSHPWWALIFGIIASIVIFDLVAQNFKQAPRSPNLPRHDTGQRLGGPSRALGAIPEPQRRVVGCIHCGQLLRLPSRMNGLANCPSCGKSAWYET